MILMLIFVFVMIQLVLEQLFVNSQILLMELVYNVEINLIAQEMDIFVAIMLVCVQMLNVLYYILEVPKILLVLYNLLLDLVLNVD